MRKLKSVLLIDDDVVNNFINTTLFEKLKICKNINIFKNGREGLNFLKETCHNPGQCPELVLLDINMPVMDGYDFVQEFNELNLHHRINIAVLTTSTRLQEEEMMRNLGVRHFFRKPMSEEKIKFLLQNLSVKEYPFNG